MNDIQRTSLAEFSRLYLSSLGAVASKPEQASRPTEPSQLPENSFAVQVVLGMMKNSRECRLDDLAAGLIG